MSGKFNMKKLLIIEDDVLVGRIYQNKLSVEGFKVSTATTGEEGLKVVEQFQPDVVLLDLMLPKMNGVEVIRQLRAQDRWKSIPIIVLSNSYLSNLVQEAWKAGATKCMAKADCTPKQMLEVIRNLFQPKAAAATQAGPASGTAAPGAAVSAMSAEDAALQTQLRQDFAQEAPKTLASLRGVLQQLTKSAADENARTRFLIELYEKMRVFSGGAAVAGLTRIAWMSAAVEALLKELSDKPKSLNPSTIRTVTHSVDFLGVLAGRLNEADAGLVSDAKVMVVDDEEISRRAVVYALDKVGIKCVNLNDPLTALKTLSENRFDLVFLDVDMPGMSGFDLCQKLRALPAHEKTPVVFVTGLSDFESRAKSTLSGGNDLIAKPFLFMELGVKALAYLFKAQLAGAKPAG